MDDRGYLELDRARAVVRAARDVLDSSSTVHEHIRHISVLKNAIKVYDLTPLPDFARGMEELREAVGGQFDGVDAEAYVRAVRGGPPYTMPNGEVIGWQE